MYEDTDEQWKEFIPDLQAILEDDYFMVDGNESATWGGPGPCMQLHTVTFKTQPMTYMVKCGDTIELSTVVERRVMHGEYLLN